ncbi:hypothetical protein GQ55_6G004500 [Panicum hallii var. hallii]|uniref:Uncharacterized protein n=1 Tax=Panicum hallii var. hallii TaxID=1504633 RepID=A0A2T7D2G7_9POAL|nr:hypothetical protein GQ55_6G004500 [Panicum hallii var. hallii]
MTKRCTRVLLDLASPLVAAPSHPLAPPGCGTAAQACLLKPGFPPMSDLLKGHRAAYSNCSSSSVTKNGRGITATTCRMDDGLAVVVIAG